MYVGIIIATPLAPDPYSTHLDHALRLLPDASPWWTYHPFRPTPALRQGWRFLFLTRLGALGDDQGDTIICVRGEAQPVLSLQDMF